MASFRDCGLPPPGSASYGCGPDAPDPHARRALRSERWSSASRRGDSAPPAPGAPPERPRAGGLPVQNAGRAPAGGAIQPRRLAVLALIGRAGERGITRDKLLALLW